MATNGRLRLLPSLNPLAKSNPVIVGIPGGPGLSSRTLKGIESLGKKFDVALIDPPGTGGTLELSDPSLTSIVESIEFQLTQLNRPIVLLGHSFGGLYVAQLAMRENNLKIAGLVFLSSPISLKAITDLERQYTTRKTADLQATEIFLEGNPSNASLAIWLASYQRLFFTAAFQSIGKKLILEDQVSYKSFFAVRLAPGISDDFESNVRGIEIPKLFLVGSDDTIVRPEAIQFQAGELNGDFVRIEEAGHFCFLEDPERTSAAIFDWMKTKTN